MPATRAKPKPADEKKKLTDEQRAAEELDAELDEALRGTFPASDPVSLSSKLKPGRPKKSG